ncbi:MAG: TonB-dependent receptor, partial [Roseibacillus sp.]|nr:TonB-dependent receptor [Roseibacillus sp.]
PFVGISQGFRAPNLSDLTRFDVARSGIVEKPNTDLDPERFVTYEAGSHFRGEGWRVSAAYHFTRVYDLIMRFQTGNTVDGLDEVEKDNLGDGSVRLPDGQEVRITGCASVDHPVERGVRYRLMFEGGRTQSLS